MKRSTVFNSCFSDQDMLVKEHKKEQAEPSEEKSTETEEHNDNLIEVDIFLLVYA